MHKAIKEFLKKGSGFIEFMAKYRDTSNLVENNYYEWLQNIRDDKKQNLEKMLEIVLREGHADPNLLVWILHGLMGAAVLDTNQEYRRIIYELLQSVDTRKWHPFIQRILEITYSMYYFSIGQTKKGEEILTSILQQIEKNEPWSCVILADIARRWAVQGKLLEIDGKYVGVTTFKHQKRTLFAYLSYIMTNSLITCNIELFRLHWPAFKKLYIFDKEDFLYYYEDFQRLIIFDLNPKSYKDSDFAMVAEIYKNLAEGNLERTESLYQEYRDLDISPAGLLKFIPLHISLITRRVGEAHLRLHELVKGGDIDYMADFFRMRIALLEGEKEKAVQYYQRLLTNARYYKAMGRISFEMHFSKEIKKEDLVFLYESVIRKYTQPKKSVKIETLSDGEIEPPIDTAMIGKSKEIKKIRRQINQYKDLEDTVYIHGETGTGKELVARALHEGSLRKTKPFLAINCGALTETLLESELFGHEVGAFTGAHKARAGIFEAAGKGTVFLDEFGEISHHLQVALLRVLENREIRPIGSSKAKKIFCRIIVATNKDLVSAVEEKKFREDLYYRVNRFDIFLPPLRERKEDVPLLLHYYLNTGIPKEKQMSLSKELLNILLEYHWPGNIRELKNELERCRIINKGKQIIEIEDFEYSRLRTSADDKPTKPYEKEEKKKQEGFDPVRSERVQRIVSRLSKAEERQKYLHELFKEHLKLTRVQIIEILQISQRTATRDLEELIEKGLIRKEMPTKSARSHYFVLN